VAVRLWLGSLRLSGHPRSRRCPPAGRPPPGRRRWPDLPTRGAWWWCRLSTSSAPRRPRAAHAEAATPG
jgi:hypothetical protein